MIELQLLVDLGQVREQAFEVAQRRGRVAQSAVGPIAQAQQFATLVGITLQRNAAFVEIEFGDDLEVLAGGKQRLRLGDGLLRSAQPQRGVAEGHHQSQQDECTEQGKAAPQHLATVL